MSQEQNKKTFLKKGSRPNLSSAKDKSQQKKVQIVDFSESVDSHINLTNN